MYICIYIYIHIYVFFSYIHAYTHISIPTCTVHALVYTYVHLINKFT